MRAPLGELVFLRSLSGPLLRLMPSALLNLLPPASAKGAAGAAPIQRRA